MRRFPDKATHQQTKTFNSQLVLKAIYDHGKISRADVARLTDLTRATVSDLVAELIERGLVEEVGRGPSAGGKSPILLSVNPDASHIIALDLANDEFCGAIVNLRGQIIRQMSLPLQQNDEAGALSLVFQLIDALQQTMTHPILGIGIGTPGLIDTTNGVVLRAVNLDWVDLPLGKLLTERYRLPIYIANDSQVSALAQYIFGRPGFYDAARPAPTTPPQNRPQGASNLVAIKLGRGIGAGIVLNGQLYQGDGFGAGEIGHITVEPDGELCRCGNRGCLETVATERAMIRRAVSLLDEHPTSVLHTSIGKTGELTSEALRQALDQGDPLALQVVTEAGRYLGTAVAGLVGVLNIQRIVLVGRMTRFGDPWLNAVRSQMRRASLSSLADNTQVEVSPIDNDVVLLGASALLLMRELGLDLAR